MGAAQEVPGGFDLGIGIARQSLVARVQTAKQLLIAAQPGESYRVYLDESRSSYAEFTCEIID